MDVNRSLEGRVAIVTGAGQGVGEGIARKLATLGAHVVIAARRAETGDPVADAIRSDGGSAECIVTDVITVRGSVSLTDRSISAFMSILRYLRIFSRMRSSITILSLIE